ncbi:MAG: SPOR domain-containing protein [Spirochaetia bacterium]|nr:SPOR domain-containing protein [Spirochaetia bacterium]
MKKRVFYVINLDRGRILMMSVLIVGFLLISFATGYRFGLGGTADQPAGRDSHSDAFMDPARQGLDRSLPANEIDSPKLASPGDLSTLPEVEKPKPEARSIEQKDKHAVTRDREPRREDRRSNLSEKRPAKQEKTERPVKPARADKTDRADKNTRHDRVTSKPEKQRSADKTQTTEKPRATDKSQVARPGKPETKTTKTQASEKNRKPQAGESAVLEPKGTMRLANVPAAKPASSFQLGTFSSRDAANRMSDQLKKQGFDAGLTQANGKFSVRVGKSTDDAELKRIEEKLRQKNYSPIRVRIP